MSVYDLEVSVRPLVEQGDADKFAHYAKKADIAQAYVEGIAITALCGKHWVPTRDPEKFPLCPECDWVMENVVAGPLAGGQ